MKKEKYVELLFQSVLIVFSVLLALFLNEVRQYQKQQTRRTQILTNLQQEIKNNSQRIEQVVNYHKEASVLLMNYVQSDSLQKIYQGQPPLAIFGQVLQGKQGLNPALLHRTAWELAQYSQEMNDLNYELQYELSSLYRLQASGVESTWNSIAALFTNPLMYDDIRSIVALRTLASSINELYQQEKYLLEKYQVMSEKLDKK